MPKKPTSDVKDHRPVLILVRPTRRGYIVEAAGSNDPFPCKDADDIGEAIVEILADPDVDRVSESMAEESRQHASRNAPAHRASEEQDEEDEEDDYDDEPRRQQPSTADDIIAGALGMLLEKGRRASNWRK